MLYEQEGLVESALNLGAYLIWNIGYAILLCILSPWLLYRRLTTGRYRHGFACKFWGSVPYRLGKGPAIWIHAVSVGEVQVAAAFAESLQKKWPDAELYITTSTQTGLALARRRFAKDLVSYAPLDFSWAIKRAFSRIRPSLLILVELEVWPNWIRTAKKLGVPVAVVNGRLSPRSHRGYRRVQSMIRSTFASLDLVAAQDSIYAARFSSLGTPAERVHVTGSLKFDGAETDRSHPRIQELRVQAGFSEDDVIWIAGSTQAPEEELAIEVFRELRQKHPRLRLVLVPRHPERFDEVAQLLDHAQVNYVCWTKRPEKLANDPKQPVILVDTVGDLRYWWGLANIAFVGGSLSQRGGQNMIEPAAFGAAVCFGPNTINFRDAVTHLLDAQAATVVHDGPSLRDFVDMVMSRPEMGELLGQKAMAVVQRHRGATARSLQLIELLAGATLLVPAAVTDEQRNSESMKMGTPKELGRTDDLTSLNLDEPQSFTGPKGMPTRSDAVVK